MTLLDPLLPAKPWYQSRTIVGALIAILDGVCRLFGLEIDKATLTDLILAAAPIIGGALAWYGRAKVERPIRFR